MEQKRVSFAVAKAIKEAGYPQACGLWYNKSGVEFSYTEDYSECYARPTYLNVWRWLWREKKYRIEIAIDKSTDKAYPIINNHTDFIFDSEEDPEEAIIAAIEYLATNDLIK